MYWVEWCPLQTHVHLESETVILFGNRVFADVRGGGLWSRERPSEGLQPYSERGRGGGSELAGGGGNGHVKTGRVDLRCRRLCSVRAVQHLPEAGSSEGGFFPRAFGGGGAGHGPTHTLILNFQPPELCKNKS